MAFYSCTRFRFVVFLLLALILWKIFHLIQPPAPEHTLTKDLDAIKALEDATYNKHKVDKLQVKVYYEALCPDSKHFFLHHLQPVSEKLPDFVNITLVPYGKTETTVKDGKYEFECQHGEEECLANKMHGCTVELMHNMTRAVSFVTCMIIDNDDPDGALDRCGKEYEIPTSEIRTCANSERGNKLLKQYGDMTQAVDTEFIPAISLNDSLDELSMSLKNFLLVVCQKIAMPLPPACL